TADRITDEHHGWGEAVDEDTESCEHRREVAQRSRLHRILHPVERPTDGLERRRRRTNRGRQVGEVTGETLERHEESTSTDRGGSERAAEHSESGTGCRAEHGDRLPERREQSRVERELAEPVRHRLPPLVE